MPWSNLHGAAKVATVCAAIFLLSGGLCGLQVLVLNDGGGDRFMTVYIIAGALEVIAIVLSAVVGFVALLVWGFGSLLRRDPK
jgi:hypothetical protein